MLTETVFRSADLAADERFDAWRECLSNTHAPMRLESDFAADFQARHRLIELAAVAIWIAARWGFPRAAEFSRAFRAAYGAPPRDQRGRLPAAPGPVDALPSPLWTQG